MFHILRFTWEADGTSILKLSLDFTLIGECTPFHLTEDSVLLGLELRPGVTLVPRDGRKVQVLELEDISRSTAATNTIHMETKRRVII